MPTPTRPLCFVLLLAWILPLPARADVFRILDDPREAAQARVDLIQQADHEIHAVYFLARNDRITLAALALLRDARRRGVPSVRLVVDAHFQHIPKAVLAHLREEGVEVRVYHPLTLRHPSWIFRRMHEKVVVVDRQRYITGGRNLAEAYFGLAKKNYADRDVYVEGASAAEADQHFDGLWSSRHVADLSVRVSTREKMRAAKALDDALRALACDGFLELNTGRNWSDGEKEVEAVRFLHDPLVPEAGPRVAARLMEILENAKSSIVIESPYLVPSRSLLDLFERKLDEGIYILIVTNSLRSSDGVLPHAGYLKYRRRLIRSGMDIREYRGPDVLHAKSVVVDGRIALIGSYNVDPRSQNLNTEVMCLVENEGSAQALVESIQIHAANASRVGSNGRPPRQDRVEDVPRIRTFGMWAARFLLPLIENQL